MIGIELYRRWWTLSLIKGYELTESWGLVKTLKIWCIWRWWCGHRRYGWWRSGWCTCMSTWNSTVHWLVHRVGLFTFWRPFMPIALFYTQFWGMESEINNDKLGISWYAGPIVISYLQLQQVHVDKCLEYYNTLSNHISLLFHFSYTSQVTKCGGTFFIPWFDKLTIFCSHSRWPQNYMWWLYM